ncbi:hypothetical protein ADUPG1_009739 [Aduncisulcus paluster]|uniref:Helicase C-terminal domain-containing protein n=1 Tax=Aduncisulcus paluster TaxID=2918883 RepID=A0ABQ5KWN8_9EUKA|nr:hypothetical protein ADUPG1_009739 [Aduncisulcus paluster]
MRPTSLTATLILAGFRVGLIHGGEEQDERVKVLQRFKQSHEEEIDFSSLSFYHQAQSKREGSEDDKIDILVGTSVAARGIDVPGLGLVINFSVPSHIEDYVHRVGRTGRAARTGVSVTFIMESEMKFAEDLVYALTSSGNGVRVPTELQLLADTLGQLKQLKELNIIGNPIPLIESRIHLIDHLLCRIPYSTQDALEERDVIPIKDLLSGIEPEKYEPKKKKTPKPKHQLDSTNSNDQMGTKSRKKTLNISSKISQSKEVDALHRIIHSKVFTSRSMAKLAYSGVIPGHNPPSSVLDSQVGRRGDFDVYFDMETVPTPRSGPFPNLISLNKQDITMEELDQGVKAATKQLQTIQLARKPWKDAHMVFYRNPPSVSGPLTSRILQARQRAKQKALVETKKKVKSAKRVRSLLRSPADVDSVRSLYNEEEWRFLTDRTDLTIRDEERKKSSRLGSRLHGDDFKSGTTQYMTGNAFRPTSPSNELVHPTPYEKSKMDRLTKERKEKEQGKHEERLYLPDVRDVLHEGDKMKEKEQGKHEERLYLPDVRDVLHEGDKMSKEKLGAALKRRKEDERIRDAAAAAAMSALESPLPNKAPLTPGQLRPASKVTFPGDDDSPPSPHSLVRPGSRATDSEKLFLSLHVHPDTPPPIPPYSRRRRKKDTFLDAIAQVLPREKDQEQEISASHIAVQSRNTRRQAEKEVMNHTKMETFKKRAIDENRDRDEYGEAHLEPHILTTRLLNAPLAFEDEEITFERAITPTGRVKKVLRDLDKQEKAKRLEGASQSVRAASALASYKSTTNEQGESMEIDGDLPFLPRRTVSALDQHVMFTELMERELKHQRETHKRTLHRLSTEERSHLKKIGADTGKKVDLIIGGQKKLSEKVKDITVQIRRNELLSQVTNAHLAKKGFSVYDSTKRALRDAQDNVISRKRKETIHKHRTNLKDIAAGREKTYQRHKIFMNNSANSLSMLSADPAGQIYTLTKQILHSREIEMRKKRRVPMKDILNSSQLSVADREEVLKELHRDDITREEVKEGGATMSSMFAAATIKRPSSMLARIPGKGSTSRSTVPSPSLAPGFRKRPGSAIAATLSHAPFDHPMTIGDIQEVSVDDLSSGIIDEPSLSEHSDGRPNIFPIKAVSDKHQENSPSPYVSHRPHSTTHYLSAISPARTMQSYRMANKLAANVSGYAKSLKEAVSNRQRSKTPQPRARPRSSLGMSSSRSSSVMSRRRKKKDEYEVRFEPAKTRIKNFKTLGRLVSEIHHSEYQTFGTDKKIGLFKDLTENTSKVDKVFQKLGLVERQLTNFESQIRVPPELESDSHVAAIPTDDVIALDKMKLRKSLHVEPVDPKKEVSLESLHMTPMDLIHLTVEIQKNTDKELSGLNNYIETMLHTAHEFDLSREKPAILDINYKEGIKNLKGGGGRGGGNKLMDRIKNVQEERMQIQRQSMIENASGVGFDGGSRASTAQSTKSEVDDDVYTISQSGKTLKGILMKLAHARAIQIRKENEGGYGRTFGEHININLKHRSGIIYSKEEHALKRKEEEKKKKKQEEAARIRGIKLKLEAAKEQHSLISPRFGRRGSLTITDLNSPGQRPVSPPSAPSTSSSRSEDVQSRQFVDISTYSGLFDEGRRYELVSIGNALSSALVLFCMKYYVTSANEDLVSHLVSVVFSRMVDMIDLDSVVSIIRGLLDEPESSIHGEAILSCISGDSNIQQVLRTMKRVLEEHQGKMAYLIPEFEKNKESVIQKRKERDAKWRVSSFSPDSQFLDIDESKILRREDGDDLSGEAPSGHVSGELSTSHDGFDNIFTKDQKGTSRLITPMARSVKVKGRGNETKKKNNGGPLIGSHVILDAEDLIDSPRKERKKTVADEAAQRLIDGTDRLYDGSLRISAGSPLSRRHSDVLQLQLIAKKKKFL